MQYHALKQASGALVLPTVILFDDHLAERGGLTLECNRVSINYKKRLLKFSSLLKFDKLFYMCILKPLEVRLK